MLWFKHYSDARQHPKFKKLVKVFKANGYYIPFATFEMIAQYGGEAARLSLKKYLPTDIAEDLGVTKEELIGIWEEMFGMELLSKRWFNKGYLYSKKLIEYRDEYSKKVERIERRKAEKLRRLSAKEEEEKADINKEEDKKRKNFPPNKKPFYKGKEMRYYQNRWWVLPEDGGKWLKFADSESQIEWK